MSFRDEEMSEVRQEVRRRFDGEAADYWQHHYAGGAAYPALAFRQRRILEMLGESPGKVLDAGCGPGVFAEEVQRRGGIWIGADLSFEMLGAARARLYERGIRPLFLQGEIDSLPFRESEFDTVVAAGVLEYLEPGHRAIEEMARVVRPGGRVIVSMPHAVCLPRVPYLLLRRITGIRRLGRRLIDRINKKRPSAARAAPSPSVYFRSTKRRMIRDLGEKGLDVVDAAYFHFHLLPMPLNEYLPGLARALGVPLETFCRTPLGYLASGLVVAAERGQHSRSWLGSHP